MLIQPAYHAIWRCGPRGPVVSWTLNLQTTEPMSFLKDNLIVMDTIQSCGTTAAAARRLSDAGYRIGLVGSQDHIADFPFTAIDPALPLPRGVVACLSSDAKWLEESCRKIPHLVLLGAQSTGIAQSYPSALSWADDYLAPRIPRINRSQP